MSDASKFPHKTTDGYDVNAEGYDIDGVYRGAVHYQNANYTQPIFRKKVNKKAAGGSGLLMLVVLYFLYQFLKVYWVTVLSIAITLIACIIFCKIAKKKIVKSGLPIFLAIIITIGIIIGIINYTL